MTASIKSRLAVFELQLSKVCKCNVEITVRGLNDFTLSAAGDSAKSLEKAKAFLTQSGKVTGWKAIYDEEIDETFAYFSAAI